MLKINKLADYGLVVMSCLAQQTRPLNARGVTELTHLSLPTVKKVLKLLARAGLLVSVRGAQGGYALARTPELISLSCVLVALDGELSITDCSQAAGLCMVEHFCGIRHNWKMINQLFQKILNDITLADMLKPKMKLNVCLPETVS
ncbi:MAG: SUF system Fe-S cluster assembly regulator [Gammaproteobacteria bacterium]|nr:SUF system Fe-S cluster assembly regulator [Gammaproteobacteria bacterium]